ncbi:MAG: AMP-binding protein [Planctomycetota bacterium]
MVLPISNQGGFALDPHESKRHPFGARRPSDRTRISAPRGLETYRGIPAFGVLQHAAEQLPDHTALIHGRWSCDYAQLNSDAIQFAATLAGLGVRPGDRVGILLPNVPEYVVAMNGIWRAGAVAVALSPLMVEEELESLLEHTDCRYLICLDLLQPLLRARANDDRVTLLVSLRDKLPTHQQFGYWLKLGVQRLRGSAIRGDYVGDFWTEFARAEPDWRAPTVDPSSPAFILATGGTTAAPKAVTLSHENLVANAWQQLVWINHSFGNDRMLGVLPFFHSYGMSTTLVGGAMLGATTILHHRFNTKQVLHLIRQHRPTVMHAVPAMLSAMNAQLDQKPCVLDSLKWVISGGAPLEESIAKRFADHSGAQVVEGYGLSEASPVTHVGHLFREPRYGVIGLPLPETVCRIVDPDDASIVVADGEVGELLVRGPQVMLGYWNDPETTAEVIRDGWLHTGDLALKHGDGNYSIVGRKKDLIITSGFNVNPRDVEEVLRRCEGILDAAVVGDADDRRGEIVHAHLVLEPGADWDEESWIQFCRKHLAAHKRPRRFTHCTTQLPRNFLGKVLRRKLRELEPEPVD